MRVVDLLRKKKSRKLLQCLLEITTLKTDSEYDATLNVCVDEFWVNKLIIINRHYKLKICFYGQFE